MVRRVPKTILGQPDLGMPRGMADAPSSQVSSGSSLRKRGAQLRKPQHKHEVIRDPKTSTEYVSTGNERARTSNESKLNSRNKFTREYNTFVSVNSIRSCNHLLPNLGLPHSLQNTYN
eukprot:scaffold8595_cov43-Prasinocladus_malaysianus.AAC.1